MRAASRYFHLLASAIALLMVACGGSGGGNGGGGSGPPGLTVSTTSVQVSADAGTSTFPTASFTITVSNAPADGVSIGGNFTENGISNVTLQSTSAATGTINIVFKDPSVLGPGVFNDTLDFGICTDSNCTALVSGTRRTVTVTYTVTGTRPPQPSVIASTHAINIQRAPFLVTIQEATVVLTLLGVEVSNVSINTSFTTNGLLTAFTQQNSNGGYDLTLWFRPSEQLSIGTYVDTITVVLCRFNSCPTGLDGSPVVITTTYAVSETVPGPNGYTIRQIAATATDVVWDAVSGKIYFSTPSSAPANANSIVELDPVSAEIGPAAFAGSDPTFEAVSDDGQFLYVGFAGSNTIRRFTLPSLTPDISLPLGNYPSGPLFAGDIQVFPGQPHSVAVARSAVGGYPSGYDVAVFDDAMQRPNALHVDGAYFSSTQFGATPDVLYGGDGVISTMSIDAAGVSLTSLANFSQGSMPARVHYDAGILYTDRGLAIDPVTSTQIGTYAMEPGEFGVAAAPDSSLNRIFFLISDFTDVIRAYDLTTFAPIAEIPLSSVAFPPNRPLRLIRWGPDGLALSTADGRILLITGPFVRP
jgi:hypothetical protein